MNRINDYFKPVSKRKTSESVCSPSTSNYTSEETVVCSPSNAKKTRLNIDIPDIGDVAEIVFDAKEPPISDHLREAVLKSVLVPSDSFVYPAKTYIIKGKEKNLRFQTSWIKNFEWLVYSPNKNGAYCKYCVLFSPETSGKGSHQVIGGLVKKPFDDWKKALEKFRDHSSSDYHLFSKQKAEGFLRVLSHKQEDVASQLDEQRKREKEKNRAFLRPIIESIMFCGEQELPLRGDKDSGPLTLERPPHKDGKFRALLRYRAGCDGNLQEHLVNHKKNAAYVSPETQNEIIGICENMIQRKLVDQVKKCGCFSILGDETLDVSGKEQFSMCVRYVHESELREDFICFLELHDLSSEAISGAILNKCEELGLDLATLVGQGYDGAANMSGKMRGVQARIKEKFPRALYVHCSSHRLNLVLSHSLSIPDVRNALGVVKEVCDLFRNNALCGHQLAEEIKELMPLNKKTRLVGMCDTRFIERHDSLNVFMELFKPIVAALHKISQSGRSVATRAATLLAAMEGSSFLISIKTCESLFSFTLPLSKYLQSPQRDLSSAYQYVKNVLGQFKDMRTNVDVEFHAIFQDAQALAREVFQSDINRPRSTSRLSHRPNPPCNSAEEFFKLSIFIPCLDDVIQGIEDRFQGNEEALVAFEVLLPRNVDESKVESLSQLEEHWAIWGTKSALEAEYKLWCRKWVSVNVSERPSDIMRILDACEPNFYPMIYKLLTIFACIPVTTSSVERSFSAMKRVKTYLRNRMTGERLTGLALMSIVPELMPEVEEVIDAFSITKKRRISL